MDELGGYGGRGFSQGEEQANSSVGNSKEFSVAGAAHKGESSR